MSKVAVIGNPSAGNLELVAGLCGAGVGAELVRPAAAGEALRAGDVGLVRLDVLHTLDGVESGLDLIPDLCRRGIRILNRPSSLRTTHDKLQTAACLTAVGVPHPCTRHLVLVEQVLELHPPVVLKPRFGSWGSDVWRCRDLDELRYRASDLVERPWFRKHGVLAQELLPSPGYDLRLLVAGGMLAGAARRISAVGEWRTNVSLGGHVEALDPPEAAIALALRSARATGVDLAGVDLLPLGDGFVVLELNGAADFHRTYSLSGRDVYADVAAALSLGGSKPQPRAGPDGSSVRIVHGA